MIKRIVFKPFKVVAAAVALSWTFLKSAVVVIWSVTKVRRKKHKLDRALNI